MGSGVFLMARGQLKLAVRAGKVSWSSVAERLPSAVGGGPGSTKGGNCTSGESQTTRA